MPSTFRADYRAYRDLILKLTPTINPGDLPPLPGVGFKLVESSAPLSRRPKSPVSVYDERGKLTTRRAPDVWAWLAQGDDPALLAPSVFPLDAGAEAERRSIWNVLFSCDAGSAEKLYQVQDAFVDILEDGRRGGKLRAYSWSVSGLDAEKLVTVFVIAP